MPMGQVHQYDKSNENDAHSDFHGDSGWKKWLNGLTEKEVWGIQRYVGAPGDHAICDNMNAGLRRKTWKPEDDPQSEMSRVYHELDRAVENGRLHRDALLYRTIGFKDMYDDMGRAKYTPGKVVSDRAFASTAPEKETATRWLDMDWLQNPVMFKIKAPKGTRGAYLSWKDRVDNPYMHESEFLMPRNQKLRIDSVSEEMIKGKRVVVYEMTAIPSK